MDKLPKYIEKKCERLDKLLNDAMHLRYEIENWAKTKGVDTSSQDWYNEVIDECSSVTGIFQEGLLHLLNEQMEKL